VPGVISAGFTIDLPLDGWIFGDTFEILGKSVPSAARAFRALPTGDATVFRRGGYPREDGTRV